MKKLNKKNQRALLSKKENKLKVVSISTPIRKIWSFIIYDYNGPHSLFDIHLLLGNGSKNDIDFASFFEYDDNIFVFVGYNKYISVKDVEARLCGYASKIKEISNNANIDQNSCTDNDFLFIPDLTDDVKMRLKELLYCFDINAHVSFNYCDNYAIIEPRNNFSSYKLQIFLPNILNLKVFTFPWFLSQIRVDNLPRDFTNEDLRKFFPNMIKYQFLKLPSYNSNLTAIITFSSPQEADKAVNESNYMVLEGNEILVTRFTIENHIKTLKIKEIFVFFKDKNSEIASKELKKDFDPYGKIYSAYVDKRFKIGHVIYCDIKDAENAISQSLKSNSTLWNKYECRFIEEQNIAVIRDLVYSVTDEDILELFHPFGNILNIFTRDLSTKISKPHMVKEITFDNTTSAQEARIKMSSKTLKGNAIKVSVLNGGNKEAPQWKFRQKQKWIIFPKDPPIKIDEELYRNKLIISPNYYDFINKLSKLYGNLVKYEETEDQIYVMFLNVQSAERIKKDFPILKSPSTDTFVNFLSPDDICFKDIKVESIDRSNLSPFVIVLYKVPKSVTSEYVFDCCGEFKDVCEVVIGNDIKNPGMNRIVIFANSRSLTGKVFCNIRRYFRPGGQNYFPIKIQYSDLEDPPPMDLKTKHVPRL